jgi:YbbR domain-containing protein
MISFFRKYVLQNLGLKLISLGMAVGLWLAIARAPVAEVSLEVPIELQNVPNDLEVSSPHIPEAQIWLRGPERIVSRIEASDVRATIDLSQVHPGERTFNLTAQHVRKPQGLEVVQIVPSQLHLAFDTRLTRSVPVRARVIGNFASGYSIDHVEVMPPTVSITGPQKQVEEVQSAITDPVDVTGDIDRASFVTHAYVADPMIQVVNPATVRVTVIMQKGRP